MNKNTIQYLAYLLDKAKTEGKDKAIVFLGAGTSVTAGIPLTNTIVRHIKIKFRKNPLIRNHQLNGETDYYELMGALTADERRDLFHFYVTRKKVKLNVANVYLAQLLKYGYVDYIVTVNFDDLILKACTLYNFLPPVYDVSNIKTVTTTDIRTGSVLYLHGQYFGQWLLNNKEELNKVEQEVLSLFNSIKTRRTWIVVGYSGNDGIFDKIKSLGSFSNEFFWVKKKLSSEYDQHVIDFIDTPNINARSIEGYYADTFFLKLHSELSKLDNTLNPPDIFYKPFTHIKSIMQNVNEVNGGDELNKQVKSLIKVSNERINKAISQFEDEDSIEKFLQKINDAILKEEFSEELAKGFEKTINDKKFFEANEILSWYYIDWGNNHAQIAQLNSDKNLYNEAIEKYKKAIKLNPKNSIGYSNWGIILTYLAKLSSDEKHLFKAIEKYEKAKELGEKDGNIYFFWGNTLMNIAKLHSNEDYFHKASEKYKKAIEINPKNDDAYSNLGNALANIAKLNSDKNLYNEAIEKYKKAININPKNDFAYSNWANALVDISLLMSNQNFYHEAIEKYKKAIEVNPKYDSAYYNWGNTLISLAKLNDDENLYKEAIDKYKKAIEIKPEISDSHINLTGALLKLFNIINPQNNYEKEKIIQEALKHATKAYELGDSAYNLSCTYALLNDKEKALKYLTESLDKNQIQKTHVLEDKDWENYKEAPEFLALLKNYE
ncbi:tetratricopeptide repeat protein [Tenacibaculum mesophilum]|uniref:tetratricopeptide repeat protein n=1 Tax=Tenacibaculum mesophilum TaxID=104268 RepID=UPI002493C190|nr:tetratricopeptide repeat protein [Tenacibaculum mesophilum]